MSDVPKLLQTVLDGTDVRALAEFWRLFLGWDYRPGHETTDPEGDEWLVVVEPGGTRRLAFQQVAELPRSTWPDNGKVPQQLHLDLMVADVEALDAQHERALGLGATLLDDSRQRDPEEPLRVYADPAGHPFCVFVG
ncbi:MAG TPA: VOC family protein [Mycobacteriales bacterium]|nr:VOC family protein [Mycobacteriales bacterium]